MKSQLRLNIEQRRGQTVIGDCFCTPPLKVLALPQHGGRALEIMQMSASPGLLDADEQHIELTLAEHSHVLLKTQAYQRIFAMHQQAVQHTELTLNDHSSLIYTPHPLVLHADAALQLNTQIHLGENVRLVWSEILTAGRTQRGEFFAFRRLSSLTRIEYQGRLILRDNLQWQPARQALTSPVHMAEFSHQATLYFANTEPDFKVKEVLNGLYQCLSDLAPDMYFGLSQAHPCLIVVRILAQQGDTLHQLIQQLAQICHSNHIPNTAPSQ